MIRKLGLLFAIGVLLLLQYALWFGSGGILQIWQLQHKVEYQQNKNDRQHQVNDGLIATIKDLKHGSLYIETMAREDLGMIKPDETFYRVVSSDH